MVDLSPTVEARGLELGEAYWSKHPRAWYSSRRARRLAARLGLKLETGPPCSASLWDTTGKRVRFGYTEYVEAWLESQLAHETKEAKHAASPARMA